MQRWRTRHDIRGICFETGGGYMGPTNVLLPSFNPFSSSSAGPNPAQANTNVGLFQVPISLDFLNPSATAELSYSPTVTQNPYQTGIFNNNLEISALGGPYNSAHASIFGGGGSSSGGPGGGGGNVSGIDYNPVNILSSNLPPPLQMPAQQLANLGSVNSNPLTHLMPMPPTQSGMMMPTTQPIAAGGVSPVLASMMAIPQQQQLSQGQTVIPGSASQAGGYDMPAPPQGAPGMRGSPASMFGATMPTAFAMPQLQQPPTPSVAQASNALQKFPALQSMQATPDTGQQALTAGAGRAVSPDQPVSQSAQDTIDELERLKGQVSPAAAQAIDNFTKSAAARLTEHKANEQALRPKLEAVEAKNENIVQQAGKAATPEGNAQLLQATKEAIYNQKTPAEQAAITRGANRMKLQGSVHPKLRTALRVTGMLGNMGIARAARGIEAQLEAREAKEENRDDQAYSKFLTEVHGAMSEQHASLATELAGSDAEMTNWRTQINANDENLRRGIANANDLYMKPGELKMRSASEEATMAAQQGAERARGVTESFAGPKLALEARNTAAGELRARTGAEQFGLAQERNQREQDKLGGQLERERLQNQKLQEQISSNQWAGKFAGLKPDARVGVDEYENVLLDKLSRGEIDAATAKAARRKAALIFKGE